MANIGQYVFTMCKANLAQIAEIPMGYCTNKKTAKAI